MTEHRRLAKEALERAERKECLAKEYNELTEASRGDVKDLARAVIELEEERERLREAVTEAWRYAEIVCEGMAGRPTADDTARLVNALAATEEE
jgi:hypothetical protein